MQGGSVATCNGYGEVDPPDPVPPSVKDWMLRRSTTCLALCHLQFTTYARDICTSERVPAIWKDAAVPPLTYAATLLHSAAGPTARNG
jgi:hypothetical protein